MSSLHRENTFFYIFNFIYVWMVDVLYSCCGNHSIMACLWFSRSVMSDICYPMDCLPGSSVHGDSPGKNTGVGCHFLLQGIFPTQESNMGLLRGRQILYRLSYKRILFVMMLYA